jgi:hypothetical protein
MIVCGAASMSLFQVWRRNCKMGVSSGAKVYFS